VFINPKIANSKKVEIEHMPFPVLRAVVEFIYSRKLPKESLMIDTDLLEAATRFMLLDLDIQCQFA
jgi:hypothetical protein